MQTDLRTDDAQATGASRRVVIGLLVLALAATALVMLLTSHHGRVSAQVVGYSASADGRQLSLRVQHVPLPVPVSLSAAAPAPVRPEAHVLTL